MPLRRRFDAEVLPEWKLYTIAYKELQREAEDLVGEGNEELEHVFQFHLVHAIEETSRFYESKEAAVVENFENVSRAVDAVAQVHVDRTAKKPFTLQTISSSPTTSTDNLWSTWQPGEEDAVEAVHELAQFFELWVLSVKGHQKGVVTLSDFVDDSFMSQLEEGALRGALQEWLQLLALIDQVRAFAVLNVIGVVKLVQRHCPPEMSATVLEKLHELPIYRMKELEMVMAQMEQVAKRLSTCLAKDYAIKEDTSSHWSLHVCPFCSHTVSNAVVMQGGRTCCWGCAVDSSQNAIVYCPLSGRATDLRALKIERVLATFLRRYFPSAHKNAPGALLGKAVVEQAAPKAGHGILSMMRNFALNKAPPTVMEDEPSSSTSRASRRRKAAGSLQAMDLSYLDNAVSKMLERLNEKRDAIGGTGSGPLSAPCNAAAGMGYDRRDRSTSLPCAPPLGELSRLARPSSSSSDSGPRPPSKPAGPAHKVARYTDLASLVS